MTSGLWHRRGEAEAVIRACRAPEGFYGSTDWYHREYWLRDIALCAPELVALGHGGDLVRHLTGFWNRQRDDGSLPVMYITHPGRWLASNVWHGRAFLPFRHRGAIRALRYALRGTVDQTLLAVAAAREYGVPVPAVRLRRAIDSTIAPSTSFPPMAVGGDWRDLMPELRGRMLLSNQCLLYCILRDEELKDLINEAFWNGRHYVSHLGTDDFDAFGSALAVLYDIVPEERYGSLAEMFRRATTPYGVRNMVFAGSHSGPTIPACDHYGTIWPFLGYHVVLALEKMGYDHAAREEFLKLASLRGFGEWYDPADGGMRGSAHQLFSAAMYLRAADALGET